MSSNIKGPVTVPAEQAVSPGTHIHLFDADGKSIPLTFANLQAIATALNRDHLFDEMVGFAKLFHESIPVCTCNEGFKNRNMTDPACGRCEFTESDIRGLEALLAKIKELEDGK